MNRGSNAVHMKLTETTETRVGQGEDRRKDGKALGKEIKEDKWREEKISG